MAILNIILLGLNFFFLIYEKKIENRSSEARPTLFMGRAKRAPKCVGASFASRRAPQPLGWHHNRKAKHKFRAWNFLDAITKKETKGMKNEPYAPTCPPLQGKTAGKYGLWALAATGSRAIETKERKAFPRTRPSRSRCPRARQPNTIKQPTNERARGHTFLIYLWGGFWKWFEFASLRANSNHFQLVIHILLCSLI